MFDLGAYLDRIGHDRSVRPDRETLSSVLFGHSCSIPFENLAVLAGQPISLDPDAIAEKLVTMRQGGYCFEQNGLLLRALTSIGFEATPIAARVRLNVTRDVLPRRTHMFVRVDLDGDSWIVDAGFGGFSLTAPLRWELNEEQPTPHETRRIIHEEGRYFHQAQVGDVWQDLCEFTGEAMPSVDQEVSNWFTSTNPTSRFKTNLTVGLARPDGTRVAIFNDRFTHRRGADVLEQKSISTEEELRELLLTKFELDYPSGTSLGGWPFHNG